MNPQNSNGHKLHIPLCHICGKPLFEADNSVPAVKFYDPLLKREVGLVHEVCRDMQVYTIGMNSHLISKEQAES